MRNGQGVCGNCHRPVIYTRTQTGKVLAVDPAPDGSGNTAVRRDAVAYLSRVPSEDMPLMGYERLHMPHPATCPARQKQPTRSPQELPDGVVSLAAYRRRRPAIS